MELMNQFIHMERVKSKATMQVTLEDDKNVPDTKPDIDKLILENGNVQIEEVKISGERITIRGRLRFKVLYLSENGELGLNVLESDIPFDEQMHMSGLSEGESVTMTAIMEDLTVGIINSRKISVQSVITFQANVEEIYDEETAVGLRDDKEVECKKKQLELAEIVIQKKDIFRIREELEIPSNLPNIEQLLWDSVQLGAVEFKALDEKVSVQGEFHAFFLYEGEEEKQSVKWYETTIPFSGVIDCQGCEETMIPVITYELSHREIEVKPDFDREERAIGIDLAIDLNIRIYEEKQIEMLSDVYGVSRKISACTRAGQYKNLLTKCNGKCKLSERIKVGNADAKILELCHCESNVLVDSMSVIENGIQITGNIEIQCLITTDSENHMFSSVKGAIPFQCTLDVYGIKEEDVYYVNTVLEQLTANIVDGRELEVKAILGMSAVVFNNLTENVITQIEEEKLDLDTLQNMPGIIAYVAKEGESLWQIGKTYYVPVKQIKEMNGITKDELRAGDKLLIVKEIHQ